MKTDRHHMGLIEESDLREMEREEYRTRQARQDARWCPCFVIAYLATVSFAIFGIAWGMGMISFLPAGISLGVAIVFILIPTVAETIAHKEKGE